MQKSYSMVSQWSSQNSRELRIREADRPYEWTAQEIDEFVDGWEKYRKFEKQRVAEITEKTPKLGYLQADFN